MRRYAVVGVVLLALSGCGAGASASAGPAYSGPDAMREKVAAVLPLSECSAAARDMDGVMFVQCVDSTGGIVRLSTVDVGAEDAASAGLSEMGWMASSGPGWVAAVNSDQATLDKVRSALG